MTYKIYKVASECKKIDTRNTKEGREVLGIKK